MTPILFSFDLGIAKKIFLKFKIVDTTIVWYLVYIYKEFFSLKISRVKELIETIIIYSYLMNTKEFFFNPKIFISGKVN
jgi:hypothetical protein